MSRLVAALTESRFVEQLAHLMSLATWRACA